MTAQDNNKKGENDMATKKQIPRKHAGKKMTDAQEKIVERIREEKKLGTLLEAKHEYFEHQERYDQEAAKAPKQTKAQEVAATSQQDKKRVIMTVAETKLGVTVVLTAQECKWLGIPGTTMTRDAVKMIRAKLGLPEKRKG